MSFTAPLRDRSRNSRRNGPDESGNAALDVTGPSQRVLELDYQPPHWGRPSGGSYFLEVLKQGVVLDPIEIPCERDFVLCGRAPECDICMDHVSISRFHCVLQFGPDGKVFVFDLGSTHGTFLNKQQIPARQFVGWEVGSLLKLGESTRWYILQEREGLSNDAERGPDRQSAGPLLGVKRGFLDPVATLRSWFRECGQVMRFERSPQCSSSQGQLMTLRIVLPSVVESIYEDIAIEASGASRKEAEFNVCMVACEKLRDLGELQPDVQDQEELGSREWKRHRQEALEEEQETFVDQSSAAKGKQDQSQRFYTVSSLRATHIQLVSEIAEITKKLVDIDAPVSHPNADDDDLDSYLEDLKAQQANEDRTRLTSDLHRLEGELRRVKFILARVDPSFDDRGPAGVTSSGKRVTAANDSGLKIKKSLASPNLFSHTTRLDLTEERGAGVKGAQHKDDGGAQEDFEDLHPEMSEDNQATKGLIYKYGY